MRCPAGSCRTLSGSAGRWRRGGRIVRVTRCSWLSRRPSALPLLLPPPPSPCSPWRANGFASWPGGGTAPRRRGRRPAAGRLEWASVRLPSLLVVLVVRLVVLLPLPPPLGIPGSAFAAFLCRGRVADSTPRCIFQAGRRARATAETFVEGVRSDSVADRPVHPKTRIHVVRFCVLCPACVAENWSGHTLVQVTVWTVCALTECLPGGAGFVRHRLSNSLCLALRSVTCAPWQRCLRKRWADIVQIWLLAAFPPPLLRQSTMSLRLAATTDTPDSPLSSLPPALASRRRSSG